tara:strand:- start:136 stop:648 length:513 start_codon:yes stop_codon:yes gene_type:complete
MKLTKKFKLSTKIAKVDEQEAFHYLIDVIVFNMPLLDEMETLNDILFTKNKKLRFKVVEDINETTEVSNQRNIIENRLEEYRQIFKNTGIRGRGIIGNRKNLIKKLNTFFKNNKNYTFDDVIKAANWHVQNTEYIMNADNFIIKNGLSRLLSTLEEMNTGINDFEEKKFV